MIENEPDPVEIPVPPETDAPAPENPEVQPPKVIPASEHKKVQRENQNLRTRLRAEEGQHAETKVKLAEALAGKDEDEEQKARTQSAFHRGAAWEIVGPLCALNPTLAHTALLAVTTVTPNGKLIDPEDGEEITREIAREIIPAELLPSRGGPGSGGGTPSTMRAAPTGRSRDERAILSQEAFERFSPAERISLQRRLMTGSK
jgi:hypothetical protein